MAHFTGVNHLAFVTSDMDETVRFWRDLLGMRLIATIGEEGFRHYFFELSETDAVAFFEWDGAEPVPQKPHGRAFRGPIAFDHVAFGVTSSEELWELKDKLSAAGCDVSGPVAHGFIHSIYAFDPNGIPIEFSYNVPGVDIREAPVFGDRDPSLTAQEGPEPKPEMWPPVFRSTPADQKYITKGAGSEVGSYSRTETQ